MTCSQYLAYFTEMHMSAAINHRSFLNCLHTRHNILLVGMTLMFLLSAAILFHEFVVCQLANFSVGH